MVTNSLTLVKSSRRRTFQCIIFQKHQLDTLATRDIIAQAQLRSTIFMTGLAVSLICDGYHSDPNSATAHYFAYILMIALSAKTTPMPLCSVVPLLSGREWLNPRIFRTLNKQRERIGHFIDALLLKSGIASTTHS